MNLLTPDGTLLSEAISALQKEIRRGREQEAMYWAIDVCEKYPAYLWRRLAVIVSEDIGLADPRIIVLIDALKRQYDLVAEHSYRPQERIILATAILAMCRAKKSRLSDNFNCVVSHRRHFEGWKPEVPDYAIDFHTRRGKKLGRSWEHWASEGCLLVNEQPTLDTYKDEAMRLRKKNGRLPARQKKPGKRALKESRDLFSHLSEPCK
jgi:replication-associated recombination protein RarA